MYTLCWSAKGGSGTTVVAAALAIVSARRRPTLLIDLGGDLPAALGVAEPDGPGVGDWLASPHASVDRLAALAVELAPMLCLLPAGTLAPDTPIDDVQAERLASACERLGDGAVVDAGRHAGHRVLHECAGRSLTVVRPCYLGLRRALHSLHPPSGPRTSHLTSAGPTARPTVEAVVVRDRERAYTSADVTRVLGVALAAEVPWDPAVARAVDSGQLLARLPTSLARPLGRLVTPVPT